MFDAEPANQIGVRFNSVAVNSGFSSALPGSYILRLDDASFLLDSASYGAGSEVSEYAFPNANLSWSAGQAVAVSLALAPPAAPDAPAAPTFGMPTASSLAVMWTEPSNTGGSAITGYDLQYRVTGSGAAFTDGPQDQTLLTATIPGLSANTAYEVQVRAATAAGDSEWSASGFGSTTVDSAIFSGTMIVGTVTNAGNTSWGYRVLSFGSLTPYSFNYGAATRLFADLLDSEPSNQLLVQFNTTGSSTALAGSYILRLDNASFLLDSASFGAGSNVSYYALPNANIDWTAGQAVAVSLVPAPPAPAAPNVTGVNITLNVAWTAPTNPPALITGYDLCYRQPGTADWTDGPQNQPGTTATITGLSENTAYEAQVRSRGALGHGSWSASGTGRTASAPLPVVSIAAIYGGETITEGQDADFTFTVRQTASSYTINVDVTATGNFGVPAGPVRNTYLVEAGSGWVSQTPFRSTTNDDVDEPHGSVTMTIVPGGDGYAVGASSSATVTILDDDATLTVNAPSAIEGDPGERTPMVFTARLNDAINTAVTVDYRVSGGTATVGTDYAALSPGTLTIPAGSRSARVTVTVLGDDVEENSETVVLEFSNLRGAMFRGDSDTLDVTGTISSNSPPEVTHLYFFNPRSNVYLDEITRITAGDRYSLRYGLDDRDDPYWGWDEDGIHDFDKKPVLEDAGIRWWRLRNTGELKTVDTKHWLGYYLAPNVTERTCLEYTVTVVDWKGARTERAECLWVNPRPVTAIAGAGRATGANMCTRASRRICPAAAATAASSGASPMSGTRRSPSSPTSGRRCPGLR